MTERTTAEVIGAFRKELVANGIGDHLADRITSDAARELFQIDGVSVRKESTNG